MKHFLAFLLATVGIMAAGALVGHFMQARTQNRWTIFLAGVAATSIGTTALPAIKPFLNKLSDVGIVSTAQAAETSNCKIEYNKVSFGEALKGFFGLDEPRYRVVVGSFKKPEDGWFVAKKIKEADPSIEAFVGNKMPCNEFYPVIVSGYVPLAQAKKIQDKVLKLEFVEGAYLSPYAWR